MAAATTSGSEPTAASISATNTCCQAPSCGQSVAKELRCGSCLSVVYCSRDCQLRHWSAEHKRACKAMARSALGQAVAQLPRDAVFEAGIFPVPSDAEDEMEPGGEAWTHEVEALDKIVALSWAMLSRPLQYGEIARIHLQALSRRIRFGFRSKVERERHKVLALRIREIPWPQAREDQREIVHYSTALDVIICSLDLAEEMLPHARQHLPIMRRILPMHDLTFVLESEYFKWLCLAANACKGDEDESRFRAYSREIEASAPRILRESRSGRLMHDPDETTFSDSSRMLMKIGFYDKALLFARRAIELVRDQDLAAELSKVLIDALVATRKIAEAERVSQGMASSSRLLTRMVGLYGLTHTYEESDRDELAVEPSFELTSLGLKAFGDHEWGSSRPTRLLRAMVGYVMSVQADGLSWSFKGKAADEEESGEALVENLDKNMKFFHPPGEPLPLGWRMREAQRLADSGKQEKAEALLKEVVGRRDVVPDYSSRGIEMYQQLLALLADLIVKRGATEEEATSLLREHEVVKAKAEALREQALQEAREMARPEGSDASAAGGGGGKGKPRGKKKKKKRGKQKGGKGKQKSNKPSRTGGAAITAEGGGRVPTGQGTEEEDSTGQPGLERQQEGGEEEQEEEEDECSVCLLELDEGEDGQCEALLLCHHRFHSRCLDLWTAKCREKTVDATCPICRAAVMRSS